MSINLVSRPFTVGEVLPNEPKYSAEITRENDFKVWGDFLRDFKTDIETSNSFSVDFSGGKIGGNDIYLPSGKEIFVLADESFDRDVYLIVETSKTLQTTILKVIELNKGDELILTKDFNGIYQTEIASIFGVDSGVVNLNNNYIISIFLVEQDVLGISLNNEGSQIDLTNILKGKHPFNLGYRTIRSKDSNGLQYHGILNKNILTFQVFSLSSTITNNHLISKQYDLDLDVGNSMLSVNSKSAIRHLFQDGGGHLTEERTGLIEISFIK